MKENAIDYQVIFKGYKNTGLTIHYNLIKNNFKVELQKHFTCKTKSQKFEAFYQSYLRDAKSYSSFEV